MLTYFWITLFLTTHGSYAPIAGGLALAFSKISSADLLGVLPAPMSGEPTAGMKLVPTVVNSGGAMEEAESNPADICHAANEPRVATHE